MNRLAAMLATMLIAVGSPVAGESPGEKGMRIAREADARMAGYGDFTASGRMILRGRGGQESTREFRFSSLEVEDDGDKNLLVFEWPPDIAGTALLNIAHRAGEDQQWLYMPALRRVKRISGANRSGSFAGSEFAYEDFVAQEVNKYTYRWLREEPCPGSAELLCHVNERSPTDPNSGYRRQVVWQDQAEYRTFRIEYFDRKDAHLKTLTVDGHERYEGRYWRPSRMVMSNHQNGKSTDLIWSDYAFDVGLRDEDFTKRALERLR